VGLKLVGGTRLILNLDVVRQGAIRHILQHEGVISLWRGLLPTL
jgi:hypothetical protein